MRTPTDIREAFEAFAERAPAEVHLLLNEPAPKRHSWRPVAAATVAVAAVVAIVAALAVALTPDRRPTPDGIAPARVAMQFTFTLDRSAGFDVHLSRIGTWGQEAYIDGRDDASTGFVAVYAAGAFDPGSAMRGARLDVNGHPGYLANIAGDEKGMVGESTAWEYAPAAWAVVQLDELPGSAATTRSTELRIAQAVRFDQQTPLKAPFRLGYLPAGLVLTSGGVSRSIDGFLDATLGFSDAESPVDATFGPSSSVAVELMHSASCSKASHPVVIHGYSGCLDHPNGANPREESILLQVSGGWVQFSNDDNAIYSSAELRKMAESMTLAPIDQPSSWFDADTAVPR